MNGRNPKKLGVSVALLLAVILASLILLEYWGLTSSIDEEALSIMGGRGVLTARILSFSASLLLFALYCIIPLFPAALRKRRLSVSYLSFIFSLLLAMLAVLALKITIQAPRPLEEKITLPLMQALIHYDYFSFPSGHAARATVLAYYVGKNRRAAAKIAAWLWVLGVSASRIILEQHWLSDVAASVILGILVSILVDMTADRWTRILQHSGLGSIGVLSLDASS